MDLTAEYCPTRRDLEQRVWNLVTRLSDLTSKLMLLTGKDHQAFISAKGHCDDAKAEVVDSRQKLDVHRSQHGC